MFCDMKSAFLVALASILSLSSPSLKAGNLLTHAGWTVKSGTVAIGPNYATFGSGYGELEQTFATVSGSTYIVQFETAITAAGAAYLDGGVSDSSSTLAIWTTPSASFVTQDYSFIASGTTATIYFYGFDAYLDLANASVSTGSFTKPGEYTGSVTVTKTLPVSGISASHTETVIAKISSSGGIDAITEPSGNVLLGGFASDSSFVYNGVTVPATLSGSTLTFTLSASGTAGVLGETTPATDTDAISLTFQ
jgi:hypothetical protein